MAATTINANWSSVTFNSVTITRVKSISIDHGGKLTPYSGDANAFPVGLFNLMNMPKVTVQTDNIAVANGFAVGTSSTLVGTLNDVKNGSTTAGGAIIYTLSNCVLANKKVGGQHQQFASAGLDFEMFSSDGTSTPIAAAAA